MPMPASAQTLGKSTEIGVGTDGSALWVIENKLPLDTTDDEIQLTIAWLENYVKESVDNAEVRVGRSMEMRNFTVAGPVELVDHKKVRYEFEWTNLAEVDGTLIRIGDAFPAGFLDLPSNADVLTIRYPEGYQVLEVLPAPGETLERGYRWFGPQTFYQSRPSITLKSIPSIWPRLMIAVLVISGLVAGWFLWFKKLFRPMMKAAKKPEGPPTEEILKSDIDRAIDALKEAGGKMYQTELVRRLDISKSKGSALLGTMEWAGTIQRTRMGRKNLITLKSSPEEAHPKR